MRRDVLDGVAGAVGDVVTLAIVGLDGLTGVVIVWQDDRHNDTPRDQPLAIRPTDAKSASKPTKLEADYHRPVISSGSRTNGHVAQTPAMLTPSSVINNQPANVSFTVVQGFTTSSKSVQSLHRNRQRRCPGTVTRLAFHDRFPVQTRRSPSDQSQPQSETGPARAPVRPGRSAPVWARDDQTIAVRPQPALASKGTSPQHQPTPRWSRTIAATRKPV